MPCQLLLPVSAKDRLAKWVWAGRELDRSFLFHLSGDLHLKTKIWSPHGMFDNFMFAFIHKEKIKNKIPKNLGCIWRAGSKREALLSFRLLSQHEAGILISTKRQCFIFNIFWKCVQSRLSQRRRRGNSAFFNVWRTQSESLLFSFFFFLIQSYFFFSVLPFMAGDTSALKSDNASQAWFLLRCNPDRLSWHTGPACLLQSLFGWRSHFQHEAIILSNLLIKWFSVHTMKIIWHYSLYFMVWRFWCAGAFVRFDWRMQLSVQIG